MKKRKVEDTKKELKTKRMKERKKERKKELLKFKHLFTFHCIFFKAKGFILII